MYAQLGAIVPQHQSVPLKAEGRRQKAELPITNYPLPITNSRFYAEYPN
jgi:hypothetical protein